MKYEEVFHKLVKGELQCCSESEWEESERGLAGTVIFSRVGDYRVRTHLASCERLCLSASQRSKPLQILVTGPFGRHWVKQADFPHRVVYDRIEDMESAKLVHFGLVRFLEHLTEQEADSWMARRAVHNTYWDPDDDAEPSDRECRVIDDREAADQDAEVGNE